MQRAGFNEHAVPALCFRAISMSVHGENQGISSLVDWSMLFGQMLKKCSQLVEFNRTNDYFQYKFKLPTDWESNEVMQEHN